MVTAKQVYDMALVLMDEVTDSGTIEIEDPEAVEAKALNLLTQIQAELLPLSVTPSIITSLEDTLHLSDRDALLIAPYGLAAHLLLNEQSEAAPFYNSRYEELKRKRRSTIAPITDNYNVINGMRGE